MLKYNRLFIVKMNRKGVMSTGLLIKLIGAVVGSVGFFVSAFGRTIPGAVLIGLGGVLLAVGEKVG